MCRPVALLSVVLVAIVLQPPPPAGAADPLALCQKTVVRQLEKYKKAHLKSHQKCLDKENKGTIAGPCLDSVSVAKLALTLDKVTAKIAQKCTLADVATLGYRSDCQYGAATPGVGGTCAALPVTTSTEFAECLACWKGAEFARYAATLYASHAVEVCGPLDDTSATCANLGETTPLPNQRALGDNAENDCQRFIAKAGVNYLLKRERIFENCILKGGTRASCAADPKILLQLAKAETQKETLILKACNNYVPVADPPFCCRTMGNQCVVATSRDDCTMNLMGTPQEGKFCNAGSCANSPGPAKSLTWWETCPHEGPCPRPTLGDIDGVIGCVDDTADALIDGLLCLQFPNAGGCPVASPTPCAVPTPSPTATP